MARSQTQKLRLRSLEKLCSPFETKLILNNENQLLCFWKIWAAKETAYKAWQRFTSSKPVYNPSKFSCSFLDENLIMVEAKKLKIEVRLIITSTYIHAYVVNDEYVNEAFTKPQYDAFSAQLNNKNWFIKKTVFNMPILENKITHEKSPISLSHDGSYYAISYPYQVQSKL
jgi:phosphopantetheinyl transferase (holo-ACP synthase)